MPISPFTTIAEIENRLHISRNYIRTVMLPHIRHEKTPQYRVLVDLGELRQWLMDNCEFSRQTELISISHNSTDDAPKSWRCTAPPCSLRKDLPFCFVKPFDFWDEPLLFPDDERFAHSESFYRAMYACGAIKIKLGARKSIFYAPALIGKNLADADKFPSPYKNPNIEMRQGTMALTIDAILCPAKDERKEDARTSGSLTDKVHRRDGAALSISIRGKDQQLVEEAIALLGERFRHRRINIRYYDNGKTAHLMIP